MALPLIPVATALAAGGSLVPHAAGGMIVTSAGGYVAGTYLSTSAIAGLLAVATASAGTGVALAVGSLKGLLGTTLARTAAIGSTSAVTGTAATASVAGTLASPLWLSLSAGGVALGLGYSVYRLARLKRKAAATPLGGEAQFTDAEAQLVERLIQRVAKQLCADPTRDADAPADRP